MRLTAADLRHDPEPLAAAPSTPLWQMQIVMALLGIVAGIVLVAALIA